MNGWKTDGNFFAYPAAGFRRWRRLAVIFCGLGLLVGPVFALPVPVSAAAGVMVVEAALPTAEAEAATMPELGAVSGAAAEGEPEEIARRLQQVYDRVMGFQAEFSQLTAMPMSRRQREGGGTVMFRKPHQMRWEYERPDHQVLVGDGEEVQLYLARSNQMMISRVEDYLDSDVTYAFFAGTGDILRDFTVSWVPAGERPAGLPVGSADDPVLADWFLRLEPREMHTQVEYLDLVVGGDPFFIRRLDIVDHFGSTTTLKFSNIRLDPELPDDFYRFKPPPDTEIMR